MSANLKTFALACMALSLTAVGARAQDPAGVSPSTASSNAEMIGRALTEWRQVKSMVSAEREDWKKGQQATGAQITVLKREIEAINSRVDEARKSIATTQVDYDKLEASIAALKRVSDRLDERIGDFEARARALLPRLPKQLAATVATVSQRLPKDDAAAEKLSLTVRYQNVVLLLSMIDKWNREVRIERDIRRSGIGQEVSVDVLYIGLAQAYFVGGKGADGKPLVAGVGSPSKDGWQWRNANELAPDIATAIAIFRNEQLAKMVRLPVQVL
ncbi:MAG: DUF3450 family protein [Planctomycetota bacterium]